MQVFYSIFLLILLQFTDAYAFVEHTNGTIGNFKTEIQKSTFERVQLDCYDFFSPQVRGHWLYTKSQNWKTVQLSYSEFSQSIYKQQICAFSNAVKSIIGFQNICPRIHSSSLGMIR